MKYAIYHVKAVQHPKPEITIKGLFNRKVNITWQRDKLKFIGTNF